MDAFWNVQVGDPGTRTAAYHCGVGGGSDGSAFPGVRERIRILESRGGGGAPGPHSASTEGIASSRCAAVVQLGPAGAAGQIDAPLVLAELSFIAAILEEANAAGLGVEPSTAEEVEHGTTEEALMR